jgi:hypothetical protein
MEIPKFMSQRTVGAIVNTVFFSFTVSQHLLFCVEQKTIAASIVDHLPISLIGVTEANVKGRPLAVALDDPHRIDCIKQHLFHIKNALKYVLARLTLCFSPTYMANSEYLPKFSLSMEMKLQQRGRCQWVSSLDTGR